MGNRIPFLVSVKAAISNECWSIASSRYNDGWSRRPSTCALPCSWHATITTHRLSAVPTRPRTYMQRLIDSKQAPPVRRDDGHRPSASAQGYGHGWRKLRVLVLREQPICADCQRAPAWHVDHIKAKTKGGDDSRENLVGLCASCHSKKTVRVDGALRRPLPRFLKS